MVTIERDEELMAGPEPMVIHDQLVLHDLTFTLSGMTPILMSNPSHMQRSETTGLSTTGKKAQLSAEAEAERGAYRDEHGNLVMPATAVRMAILQTATKYKPQGARLGTFKTIVLSSLHMVEEWFPLLDEDGKAITTFEVDLRRVVMKDGSGIVRARARIPVPWLLRCHFWLDTSIGHPEDIQAIVKSAGLMNGIGDFRPQKMGWFGRFTVSTFTVS